MWDDIEVLWGTIKQGHKGKGLSALGREVVILHGMVIKGTQWTWMHIKVPLPRIGSKVIYKLQPEVWLARGRKGGGGRGKELYRSRKNSGGFVLGWVGGRATHEQNPVPKRSYNNLKHLYRGQKIRAKFGKVTLAVMCNMFWSKLPKK